MHNFVSRPNPVPKQSRQTNKPKQRHNLQGSHRHKLTLHDTNERH